MSRDKKKLSYLRWKISWRELDSTEESLAKRWKPRGFSRVAAGFSSYDGDLNLPLGLALGSPIFQIG